MSTSRTARINITLLKVLRDCAGFALPESTLREHLDCRERPRVNDEEWKASMTWLQDRGAISSLPALMGDDDLRWLITEKGEVLLGQH